jgi:hypothetical protein
MVKVCCVDGCTSNYGSSKAKNAVLKARNEQKNGNRKSRVFGFPSKTKSKEERLRWIQAIPYWSVERDEKTKENPVVCIRHWPENFPIKLSVNKKDRPLNPPSIFEGIPSSQIPTPPPPPRPTEKCTSEIRNRQEDEIKQFLENDKVCFKIMSESLRDGKHEFDIPTVSFISCGEHWIQSIKFVSGIPAFSLKIRENQTYVGYSVGVECNIPTLTKNRITKLNS